MELGFFETNINGREVIAHDGDTVAFHTSLHLFIEGWRRPLRVVQQRRPSRAPRATLRTALFQDFADRYFPDATKDGRVDPKTARRACRR